MPQVPLTAASCRAKKCCVRLVKLVAADFDALRGVDGEAFAQDRDQHIDRDCDPQLRLDCVFGSARSRLSDPASVQIATIQDLFYLIDSEILTANEVPANRTFVMSDMEYLALEGRPSTL